MPTAASLFKTSADASQPKTWKRSFEGWKYEGGIGPGGIVGAKITLQSEDVAGLKKYAEANRSLAKELYLTAAAGQRLYITPNSGILGRPGFGSLEAVGLEISNKFIPFTLTWQFGILP